MSRLFQLFLFSALFYFVISYVESDAEKWHMSSIAPHELKATSQDEIRRAFASFGLCEEMLRQPLSTIDMNMEMFREQVEVGIVHSHPKDGLFGVSIVFITELDKADISPVMDVVSREFLLEFQGGEPVCPELQLNQSIDSAE